jgi:hypothetical protein
VVGARRATDRWRAEAEMFRAAVEREREELRRIREQTP